MAHLSLNLNVFSDGSYTVKKSSVEMRFTKRFLHDWERDDWKGSVWRSNLPEVFRCGELDDSDNGHYVRLTEETQFFWFDICCKSYYGKYHNEITKDQYTWLAKRWTSVGAGWRAFTNKHGLDTFRNYVLDINRGTEDPAIYTLVCGGMTTKPLNVLKNKNGVDMAQIPTFDPNNFPDVRSIDIKNDPRIFNAVNITSTVVSAGGYSITPFAQFQKDGISQDVLLPLFSNEPIYFPVRWLGDWNNNQKINPYNPAKPMFQNYPY